MQQVKNLGKYSIPDISDTEVLYGTYYIHNNLRSKKARDVDNGMPTKNVTTNVARWMLNMNRNDIEGIDTQKRKTPRGYTKEKGKSSARKLIDTFWDGGR